MTDLDIGDVATLVGLVILAVGGVNIGRSRRKDELIELQERQAEALREEIADNERRCDDKIARLVADNAELRGRVAALQEQHAQAIGTAIAPVIADRVVKALKDGEW